MNKNNLRIIFMGTPEFAVPSLEKLVENNYNVVAVVTSPDKPAGRGLKFNESDVKKQALINQIPVLQPTNLKDEHFIQQLKSFESNLFIVVAFRMLPEQVWSMPKLGTFNLHASLLPNYRGAAPINWAIINGESKTGVTTFFLKHEIDTGDIILQEEEPILESDTAGELYHRLMLKGSNLVVNTVELILSGKDIELKKQELTKNTKSAPKIFKETCEINFNQPIKNVYNFIRGLSPYPSAWTKVHGKQLKIFNSKIGNQKSELQPGAISTDNKTYIRFNCIDYQLEVLELQIEGKKRMKTEDFLRGNTF